MKKPTVADAKSAATSTITSNASDSVRGASSAGTGVVAKGTPEFATLLARYPHVELLIGRNFRNGLIHRQILSRSDHGTMRLSSPMDGLDRLAAARALTHFPISIIATTTVAAALDDWREQTRYLIAAASLFVILIAALLFLVVRKLLRQHRMEKQRLDTAINNMTQGLLLFDASQRLVVCNQRYIEMYGLSAEVLKPGCSFREVGQSFSGSTPAAVTIWTRCTTSSNHSPAGAVSIPSWGSGSRPRC